MNLIKIFFSVSFGLLCINAWGKDPIQSEVTVTKSYEPQLDNRIQKIPFSTMIPDSMRVKPKILFSSKHIMVTPGKFNPRPLDALAITEEQTETNPNPFWDASLGLGTLIDPFLHVQGSGVHDQYGTWNADFLHSSTHRHITRFNGLDAPNHKSLTQLNGGSEWILKNRFLLRAEAGYENRYATIYGYSDTSLTVVPHQTTNLLYGNVSFENILTKDAQWTYKTEVNTQYWSDAYDNSEFSWGIKGFLEKRRTVDDRMGIKVQWDQLAQENISGSDVNSVFQLTPYYTRRIDRLLVTGALKLVYDNRSAKPFSPYLNAKVSYDLMSDQVACPFAAIEGDHQINRLSNLTQVNPYLSPNMDYPANSAYRIGIRYGVEGRMGNIFSYHISQAFKSVHDALFFANNTNETGGNEGFFISKLDNIRIHETLLEATYHILPGLSADGKLFYRGYHMKTLQHAYQLPAVESKITVSYAVFDKLKLGLSGHYYGDFYGNLSDTQLTEINVPSSFNLSFQGVYQLYNNYRLWMNVDNILNQDISQFYRYNDYGIHLQVGIGLHF